MKKTLLLAGAAAVALGAAAQGVDPFSYQPKEGYQLTNKWMMSAGVNGEGAVAADVFNNLPYGNPGKATFAAMLNGKVYISCSQTFVDGIDETTGQPAQILDALSHFIVLNAETGAYEGQFNLTLDGAHYGGLIAANCIGVDDFGHLWLTPYVSCTYAQDEAGNAVVKPIPLYQVNPENGEMKLIYSFELDDIDGPTAGGRIDFCDVSGDITRQEAPCMFAAIPNEVATVCIWRSEQGAEDFDFGIDEGEYCVADIQDTYPADQTAWNYSPLVSFVKDEDYSGSFFYTDGHTTWPASYSLDGTFIESLNEHQPATEDTEDPWNGFMPGREPNGVREFSLNGQHFLTYALNFPGGTTDSGIGGHLALIKLDDNAEITGATPMWTFPGSASRLGNVKGEGRFAHAITVGPERADANGKKAVDIMLYKDCNGVGVWTLAEDGFVEGVTSAVVDAAEGPAEYFNLNGVKVNPAELSAGLYIVRQGNKASKVVVK